MPFATDGIDTIMLDIDGILVDNSTLWHRHLEADFGIVVDQLQKEFFDQHWEEVVIGKVSTEDRRRFFGIRKQTVIYPRCPAEPIFQQHVPACVRRRGFVPHCATNQEYRRVDFLWSRLVLKEHFDPPHYSASVQERKPNREFFSKVTQKARLHPHQVPLVDDSTQNIEAGRRFGGYVLLWTDDLKLLPSIALLPVAFH